MLKYCLCGVKKVIIRCLCANLCPEAKDYLPIVFVNYKIVSLEIRGSNYPFNGCLIPQVPNKPSILSQTSALTKRKCYKPHITLKCSYLL